jgi:hypothetical protein
MKLLFTGKGKAGSWQIRGEQLGHAVGAVVSPQATVKEIAAADMIVVVKRCYDAMARELKRQCKRWVFDVVDFYPQPQCTNWSKDYAINWVKREIDHLNPTAVVWPNQKMMDDCSDGRPSKVLYHHHRPNLAQHVAQDGPLTVAYEGSASYLDGWEPTLRKLCAQRGWTFVINPPSLAVADIVVALRGPQFAGYAQVNWKSNVKLANAQGAGIPFISQAEEGYIETQSGAELFIENAEQLEKAFDVFDSLPMRLRCGEMMKQKSYPLYMAATDMKEFLYGL